MTSIVLALLFAGAAILAIGSVVMTWTRLRSRMLANLAALRTVDPERSFFVRMIPASFDPALAELAPRPRQSTRRPVPASFRPPPATRAAA